MVSPTLEVNECILALLGVLGDLDSYDLYKCVADK